MTDCCQTKDNYQKGFLSGLLYGLIPHSFCIAFLILSHYRRGRRHDFRAKVFTHSALLIVFGDSFVFIRVNFRDHLFEKNRFFFIDENEKKVEVSFDFGCLNHWH